MDTHTSFKQLQKMRPSCFSKEEQCRYKAEKMMLRQFMLMKQQGQVPDYLSVRDMKTWLLRGRSFLEEFQQIIERRGKNNLVMAELAWTTARHFCLTQMEEELLEQLDKEQQLSQLLSRKVTLEGLRMFVSVVHPAAEEDVQIFLPSLHSKLLRIFGGIQLTSCPLSEGAAKPAELLELEQSAASLVPEVVDTALKFLLEEPELKDRCKVASAMIGKMLTNSAAPCLSQFGSVSRVILLSVCTRAARFMVEAIFKRFDERSKSFHLMDYDESFFSARYGVICAIQDMDRERPRRLCTSEVQERGLLEKREVSPQVDENMATSPKDVTEDALLVKPEASVAVFLADEPEELLQDYVKESHREETLVQDFAIQNMDREKHRRLCTSEVQEKGLLKKREVSPQVDENMATAPKDVTEDTLLVKPDASVAVFLVGEPEELLQEYVKESHREETLVQDFAIQNMDHEVKPDASVTVFLPDASTHGHVSLGSSEWLEEEQLEKREASPEVPEDEELGIMQYHLTKVTSFSLQTNVVVNMVDETEVLQQEEMEESETQKYLADVKKKKGVRAFFHGVWKMMSCCFSVSTKD